MNKVNNMRRFFDEEVGMTAFVGQEATPAQVNYEELVMPMPSVRAGDPRFHALLKEIGDLHDKKQRDYGTSGDPFANVRGSQEWGVHSWVGAMIRANDKLKRLQNFAKNGTLANESARDSFMDLAVYALIALVLFDEEAS